MKYSIAEIFEMKSLIQSLLSVNGKSYDGQERAIEVGAFLQAHVANGSDLDQLRDAVAARRHAEQKWHEQEAQMQSEWQEHRKRYLDRRSKLLSAVGPKQRALEEWYDEALALGRGNRSDADLYCGHGSSLKNWLDSGRCDDVSVSQPEMVSFLQSRGVVYRTTNGERRWDAAQFISGYATNGKYLADEAIVRNGP